ncbi:hypothetical protein Pyn_18936 [Prunus yedoensis var. nudiflora]|uniref:Ubiquitin fusion degradation protein UFD1 N-terminal subdomain 2 domain-containing protein n=1 Tax=Prunus yedoensis var. nudiflora TaxID=2094558 RepID=A0A314YVV7_PRUYE|nr:hypothetical protein Pyn_18936 [Prunus yedoensis var. nudiflora]
MSNCNLTPRTFLTSQTLKPFWSYSCLTSGDTIMVPYNSKKYYINIIETKPSSAISIVDTDCEVDFAPPLDYVEPEKKPAPSTQPKKRPQEAEDNWMENRS